MYKTLRDTLQQTETPQMDVKAFKTMMHRHRDNGRDLARALGITASTLSVKIHSDGLTQRELRTIIDRYDLNPLEITTTFFRDTANC